MTPRVKEVVSGTCKYCGCTDERACDAGCGWVDDAHTVCSSPACVLKQQADQVKTVMAEFEGKACACGNRKRAETSFCFACTQVLPAPLRQDLGLSMKGGYLGAYLAAIAVLSAHGRVNRRTA